MKAFQLPRTAELMDAAQGALGFGATLGLTSMVGNQLFSKVPMLANLGRATPWVKLGLGWLLANAASGAARMLPFRGSDRLARNVAIGGYIAVGVGILNQINQLKPGGMIAPASPVIGPAFNLALPGLSDYAMDFGVSGDDEGVDDYVTAAGVSDYVTSGMADMVEAGQLGVEALPGSGHLAAIQAPGSDLGGAGPNDWAHDYRY